MRLCDGTATPLTLNSNNWNVQERPLVSTRPANLSDFGLTNGPSGAFGLGTGLEYIPAAYAELPELVALGRAAKRPGSVYVTHLRDEGAALDAAIAEAVAVGRQSAQPVHISHIKSTGTSNWGKSTAVLRGLDSLAARGFHVTYDVYPYPAYSTYSDVLFPAWALADGDAAVRQRLGDSATIARLRREMPAVWAAQTGGTAASILFRTMPSAPQYAGRTLADYLRDRNTPETVANIVDALITLQRDGSTTLLTAAPGPCRCVRRAA